MYRTWTKVRSEIAQHAKAHPGEPTPIDLAQELKTARLADHIRKVVESAPPLTAEQRDKLAVLLRGSAA